MTFQNGLKAGGIGAAISVILNLLGIIPLVGCCTFILTLLLWVGVGVLAGYYGNKSNPMQTAGEAAKAGAVAGAVTSLVGGGRPDYYLCRIRRRWAAPRKLCPRFRLSNCDNCVRWALTRPFSAV